MQPPLFSIYWELEKNNMSNKKSYSIEYDFHSSPQLLFQYLSTPSGLSEWFADNVNSRGELFEFIWDDSEEQAKLIQKKNNDRVRFQWLNDEDDFDKYYFEFKIQVDEITKDVSLIITDFEVEDEIEESKMLWNNLVSDLKQVLGAS
jgi:uncharacterized protein YndB with AHSA1/START domain|tara:strand:- start:9345 stop:9785 length:441 start_codon:yes stop_codon:yes gene_type:complete